MYRYQTQTKFNAHNKQTNRMIKKQTQTFNAHNKQTNRIINVAYQFVLSQLNFPEIE